MFRFIGGYAAIGAAITLLLTFFAGPGQISALAFDHKAGEKADHYHGDLERLQALANGDHRHEGHAERNQYRHPVETLLFFGIREDMTVVELSPGGGWYTEVIAPFVNEKGRYYASTYDPEASERNQMRVKRYSDKLAAHSELYSNAVIGVFDPKTRDYAPEGSADMVLTFRNLHNWLEAEMTEAVFMKAFKALKPGGVLGFIDHRADDDRFDPMARTGYVSEEYVIKAAEAAGFRFDAKSEVNANAKDTKDHPEGVWTLPPTYRLKDMEREKYAAIGESDRMTLKFVKP